MGHFEELQKKAHKTLEEQEIIDRVLANRRGEKYKPKKAIASEQTDEEFSEKVEESDPEPILEDEPERKQKRGKRKK